MTASKTVIVFGNLLYDISQHRQDRMEAPI